MNDKLQYILTIVEQSEALSPEQKKVLTDSIKEADKTITITEFKLDRTEKVKRTTAILLEETIAELELKRKAVEEQNHELEIESALERVRSVAMGMKKPEDMLDVCKTIAQQLALLNVKEIRNVQTAIFYDEKGFYTNYEFYAKHDKTFITDTEFRNHPIAEKFADQMMKGPNEVFTHGFTGKEVKDWLEYQKGTNVFIDTYLESANSLNYYWYSLGPVALGISTYSSLIENEIELFKRFRNVFELAYRRYLDIEKAEAQAREAQIEAALERVRSRSMAMHKSDELLEVINVVSAQLQQLDIKFQFVSFGFLTEDLGFDFWLTSPAFSYPERIRMPYIDNPIHNTAIEAHKKGISFFSNIFSSEDNRKWLQSLLEHNPSTQSEKSKEYLLTRPGFARSAVMGKNIDIFLGNYIPAAYSEEENQILIRFAKVFEQSYTRFLDLQKAEAQSRESQIQLALERVRARTMAMQRSDELSEAVYVLFQQFKDLGERLDQATIGIINEDEKFIEYWVTMYGQPINKVFKFSIDEPNVTKKIYDAWKENKRSLVIDLRGNALKEFMSYRASKGGAAVKPDEQRRIINVAFFSKGLLNVQSNEERPEESIKLLERFASVFDQTYTRFLDLKNAEAQTRESQIQLALERVRARTMAMQHSDELSETAYILFQQFKQLGEDPIQITIGIFNEEQNTIEFRITGGDGSGSRIDQTFNVDINEPTLMNKVYKAWKENKKYEIVTLEGKELAQWIEYRNKKSGKYAYETKVEANDRRSVAAGFFSKGLLSISTMKHPSRETVMILERFAGVFDLTYTRFLDLKNAEAQAREAQIEASLERVRSRTMAMHQTSELQEVIHVVHKELLNLKLSIDGGSFVVINKDVELELRCWGAGGTANTTEEVHVPHFDMPFCTNLIGGIKSGPKFFTEEFSQEEKKQYFTKLFEHKPWSDLSNEEKEQTLSSPEGYTRSVAVSKHTSIFIINHHGKKFTVDENDILKRFAKVFEQTYTRFLDLQKAETQAREAQIEASLEKVRASAMAMHNSNDISSTTNIVFAELKKLDIQSKRCGVVLLSKQSKTADVYAAATSSDGQFHTLRRSIEMTQHPSQIQQYESWLSQNNYISILSGEDLKSYYQLPFFYSSPSYTPPEHYDHKEYGYYIPFSQGLFYAWTENLYSDSEVSILNRFKSIIDLTFRRYLDLQKAEAQAREAQIETALEKVRSRTLAMQRSDELAETAAVLFQQLIKLGIEPNRLYIGIINDESGDLEFWITDEDGNKVSKRYVVNIHKNISIRKMYDGWKEKNKTLTIDMQGEELMQWLTYWNKEFGVPFKEGAGKQRRVQNISYFSSGFIAIASWGDQPEETVSLLDRFAAVFNLTYTRFNDLKVAEAHALQAEEDLKKLIAEKKKTEEALTELKATQAQLVQSEKMASLGELTAGIAHEIQNPLNFVNNFSEVSGELLDEMKTELEKGDTEEAKIIAEDVKQNLEKILHHGKRADAIVKGMLQHSRSSSGQKEPTDINALADEYLRLAYHGLRAKDKSFNAKFEAKCDSTIEKINIIPQDIGRVILNLINNAFYAVSEKKKQNANGYEPTVIVSTKKINDKIELRVIDNGGGIPEKVREKIFQPFFTTKPTGEGTGLGLSLSYDIITKGHGGELKVETKEGEGTEFIISMPNHSS